MQRPEQTHRVVWKRYEEPDPVTGRPVLKFVWPSYRPARLSSWRDRFQANLGWFDVVALGLVAVCIVLAVAG